MKYTSLFRILFFAGSISLILSSCKLDDVTDPNNPNETVLSSNPTLGELNNLVAGTESVMRNNYDTYLDNVGIVGREHYRFSSSDPRYTSEMLGQGAAVLDNNSFYTNNSWTQRYRAVKNANILLKGATNATTITAEQRKTFSGFAKTIISHQLLLNLTQMWSNGVRVDVADPDKLGGFVTKEAALEYIANLLNEANSDLNGQSLSTSTNLGNRASARALAARVAIYRQKWADALTYLNESFLDLNGDLNAGCFLKFSTATGDQLNRFYYPRNATGELRAAHPAFITEAELGDTRLSKIAMRTAVATQSGLSSNYDVAVYSSNTASYSVIRNEELILLYAEAKAQLGETSDALIAINRIRNAAGLADYTGGTTTAELINEVLKQRRYSLFCEGHRWIDMRRYNKLNELPLDRPDDNVWMEYPIPFAEL